MYGYPPYIPFMMPQPQQQNGMTPREFKKFIRAYASFEKEWQEKNKKPEEKKKDEPKKEEGKRWSPVEIALFMMAFSPVIGMMTLKMYVYCWQQIQLTISTLH